MSTKSPQSERHALSAIMRGGQKVRQAARERLDTDMFYEHEAIANAALSLLDDEQRPDPSSVKARVDHEALEDTIEEIASIRVTPTNVIKDGGAFEDVRQSFRAAELLLAAQQAEDDVTLGDSPSEIQRSLESDLRDLDERLDTGGSIHVERVVDDSLNRILETQDDRPGLVPPLGMDDTFHVGEEDILLFGGRTTQGKTALALRFVMDWTISGDVPGAYFSIEGAAEELGVRLLGMNARVNTQEEPEDEEKDDLRRSAQRLREAPLYIDDSATVNVSQIQARVRRLKHDEGIQYAVVDYLQLLNPDPSEDYEKKSDRMTGMVRNLKKLARNTSVPIIIVTQINRGVERRDPPVPRKADIREGGEEPADKILLVFRPEHYGISSFRGWDDTWNRGWIHVAKHRNGPTEEHWMSFVKRYSLWGEASLRDEAGYVEPDDDAPF